MIEKIKRNLINYCKPNEGMGFFLMTIGILLMAWTLLTIASIIFNILPRDIGYIAYAFAVSVSAITIFFLGRSEVMRLNFGSQTKTENYPLNDKKNTQEKTKDYGPFSWITQLKVDAYDSHKAAVLIFGSAFIALALFRPESKWINSCFLGIFYGLIMWIGRNFIKDYRERRKTEWDIVNSIYFLLVLIFSILFLAALVCINFNLRVIP